MCLGIPGKIIEITGDTARVEVGGGRFNVSLMLMDNPNVGDYVVVHAGFAIKRIDEGVSAETLEIIGRFR